MIHVVYIRYKYTHYLLGVQLIMHELTFINQSTEAGNYSVIITPRKVAKI